MNFIAMAVAKYHEIVARQAERYGAQLPEGYRPGEMPTDVQQAALECEMYRIRAPRIPQTKGESQGGGERLGY